MGEFPGEDAAPCNNGFGTVEEQLLLLSLLSSPDDDSIPTTSQLLFEFETICVLFSMLLFENGDCNASTAAAVPLIIIGALLLTLLLEEEEDVKLGMPDARSATAELMDDMFDVELF